MSDIVPAAARLAAKRGFVRTTAQAYAAAIPTGGISAAALSQVIDNPNPWLIGTAVAAWVISPPLAGLASFLTFISQGIPDEYVAAARSAVTTTNRED